MIELFTAVFGSCCYVAGAPLGRAFAAAFALVGASAAVVWLAG